VAPIITAFKPGGSSCSGRKTRLTGDRVTDLLPPPAGRAGHRLRLGGRWKSGSRLRFFVNAPYDKYVNPGTRFWNASGVDASVGAGGVEVRTQSLIALIAGGLAFDTPPFRRHGRARRREHGLYSLHGPGRRDEAGGRDIGALCALLK